MIVDGNALAGVLSEVLGSEATLAVLRCVGCGRTGQLAGTVVLRSPMGDVVRCRDCDTVLITRVTDGDRAWVGLPGGRLVTAD